MNEIWCNGRWLPAANHPGAAQDRGAFLGLGLFETMLAVDGAPVFAGRHLARLGASCTKLGWPFDFDGFHEVATELLLRNGLISGSARLRLIMTAGSGAHDDLTPGDDRLVWLAAFPLAEVPDSLEVCVSPWPRNERSPLAGMKTACYAENLVALDHARRLGFQETIILNTAGHLCETATANLFLLKDGILLTPSLDTGCLPGIGREVILMLAGRCRIEIRERPLSTADLAAADEVFLSSATRGPVPITRIGDRSLCRGMTTARLKDYWNVEIGRR